MMRAVVIIGTAVPLLNSDLDRFETLLDTAPSGHYLAILSTFTRLSWYGSTAGVEVCKPLWEVRNGGQGRH